jgi:hypothetical protein
MKDVNENQMLEGRRKCIIAQKNQTQECQERMDAQAKAAQTFSRLTKTVDCLITSF